MLEVYLDPATINSRKVLAGLELVGIPYHRPPSIMATLSQGRRRTIFSPGFCQKSAIGK